MIGGFAAKVASALTKVVSALTIALSSLLLFQVSSANANSLTWNFSYFDTATNGSAVSASGVLTTTDLIGGIYGITAISGTRDGIPITLGSLLPSGNTYPDGQGGDYFIIDNILNPAPPLLSFAGFAFQTNEPSAYDNTYAATYNVYYENGVYYELSDDTLITSDASDLGTPVEFSVSETPLPSAWSMLLIGLVGLGFFLRPGAKNRFTFEAA